MARIFAPGIKNDEGQWLLFTRKGIDIDTYPAVKEYLEGYRERLTPRPRHWDKSYPWHGRKPGSYEWYEIQDTIDYYAVFDQPKIFWPDIAKLPRFSWDDEGKVSSQ